VISCVCVWGVGWVWWVGGCWEKTALYVMRSTAREVFTFCLLSTQKKKKYQAQKKEHDTALSPTAKLSSYALDESMEEGE
jgi:hypothetical protein